MVSTGLQNNQLFPGLLVTLLATLGTLLCVCVCVCVCLFVLSVRLSDMCLCVCVLATLGTVLCVCALYEGSVCLLMCVRV